VGQEELPLLKVLRHERRLLAGDPGVYRASASQHQAELESLLTLKFQTFKEVPVIGEGGKVTPFPGAKQPQKKVLI
jgi:hypothetical protein